MKNRNIKALRVSLFIVIFMFFSACSVETVEEYNSRINLTQDIEEITSTLEKFDDYVTSVEKETTQRDDISEIEVLEKNDVTQAIDSTTSTRHESGIPMQTNVETFPTIQVVEETEKNTIKVKTAIYCDKAVENWDKLNDSAKNESIVPRSGIILGVQDYNAKEGDTAFDVLKSICGNNGISLNYTGNAKRKTIYINGINGLYERDCGSASGWVYSVNGEFINVGVSGYTVKQGDIIEFHFTDGSKVF